MRKSYGPCRTERGFTLVETLVTTTIVSLALVAIVTQRGRPPERRIAALALQGALAETRALAASNADTTGLTPSGATLTVIPLPAGGTRVAIFASRPIAGAPPLRADQNFPAATLPVTMTIPGQTLEGQPFSIFVSSSGYASVAANYAYDAARPKMLASDPGCDEAKGVTIAIVDGTASETHPFDCRGARYDANTAVAVTGRPLP